MSRVATQDGGFVQTSHVQVQQAGASEATLLLKLPSAKLDAALTSLGRLAPVRAESRSLQDITSSYDSARQRVAELAAEHRALLRALAAAHHRRADRQPARTARAEPQPDRAEAQRAFQSVSRRASTAEVEVTVLADSSSASEGLTLHRGLHDAGRVLTVALIVLLIGAAVLVPLAALIAAAFTLTHAWRRWQRERVLNARR